MTSMEVCESKKAAIEFCGRLADGQSESGECFMNEGLTKAIGLIEEQKLEEARSLLLELLVAHPNDPNVLFQCALAQDMLGMERDAIPLYHQAIDNGLSAPELEHAIIGLGSSYRSIGEYQTAADIFERGLQQFPDNRVMQIFLAMVCYNRGKHAKAMELLLRNLAETTEDLSVIAYRKALLYYSDKLDDVM